MAKLPLELKTDYVHIWLEGNILMAIYADKLIDEVIAREIVRERIEVFGNNNRFIMAEIRGVSFTKEARDYLGSKEACVGGKKLAIIATSPITVTLGNLYLKISKPPVVTRIFSNKEEAKKWLLKNH